MAHLSRNLRRLRLDQSGSANTEYAVVIGLILLGVVAVIAHVGPSVLARWSGVSQKLGGGPGTIISGDPNSSAH